MVEWRFSNILLPDSTTNEALSHGLVSFRIKPMQPLFVGTEIANTANIYFDFNEPVITGPNVLVAEFSTGVAGNVVDRRVSFSPNPAHDRITIAVTSGSITSLRLFAADGRSIAVSKHQGSTISMDTAGLPAGVYFAELHFDDGTRITKRFTKY